MTRWKPNTGLYFDGTDYLSLSSPGAGIANVNPAHDAAWSISCWIDGRVSGTNTIYTNDGGSSDPGWHIQFDSSGRFKIKAGSVSHQTTTSVRTGGIYDREFGFINAVFTYDGSGNRTGWKVYSNGTKDPYTSFTSSSISSIASSATIKIGAGTSSGASNTDYVYYSTVHNVSMWSKELTASEVHEIYDGQGGAPGAGNLLEHSAASNLVGWWLASHPSDSNSTIYDSSANSNNFTGNGFTSAHFYNLR